MENLLGDIWDQGQAGGGGNDNFDDDDDDDHGRDADGAMDGGVALNPDDSNNTGGGGGGSKRRSTECDLILFMYCEEALEVAPSHPVLRPGVVVSIGLDKSTKLTAVFNRYIDFCNETGDSRIAIKDLEFVHCQLLSGNDTAEASALMKNDRILVRKHRGDQREAEEQKRRLQRDADRNFFQQIRNLMPDSGVSKVAADVILDCKGMVADEKGRNQKVLKTTVRAHSTIIRKRCPWLGDIIQRVIDETTAKQQKAVNATTNTPEDEDDDVEDGSSRKLQIRRVESDGKSAGDTAGAAAADDDDGIVLSVQPKEKKEDASSAAEIENDDEDDDLPFDEQHQPKAIEDQPRSSSPVLSSQQQQSKGKKKQPYRVSLPNHSPAAVSLLLEYCYSNRVHALGHDAFVQACKTKPHKHQGPVPPYHGISSGSRRWPNNGQPTISLSVALAGITLAEEAKVPRLSLMCEVAAAQLLSASNVIEALSLCTAQKRTSGNDLPRLRKAAMDIVLRSGPRGVVELGRTPSFKKALLERKKEIVPTLLHGTMEAVTSYEKTRGVKRDRSDLTYPPFEELDREDSYKREKERRKRRQERWEEDPDRHPDPAYDDDHLMDEIYEPPLLAQWAPDAAAAKAAKRSLKRMRGHLDSLSSRRGGAAVVTRAQYHAGRRSSSGRRRSSQN